MTTEHQPNQDTMSEQTAATPDAAPAPDDLPPEQALQAANDRIAALEAELAEMKERWMRSEAENANVRPRARKDVDDTRQYAVQKFATDVVEAAENLKRGIDSLPRAVSRSTGDRRQGPRGPGGCGTQLRQHVGAERDQARRPGRPDRSTPTCTRRWRSRRAKPMLRVRSSRRGPRPGR